MLLHAALPTALLAAISHALLTFTPVTHASNNYKQPLSLIKQRLHHHSARAATGSAASLTVDGPQYAYVTEVGIGKGTYKMIVATGTPQTTLGKYAKYSGGKDTGKVAKGALSGGQNYTVKLYTDSVNVGGVTAAGTTVGFAKDAEIVLVERGTTQHPVGVLGLAPDSPIGFSAMDASLKPLVTTSGPKAFAIDLTANTLTFGDSFEPAFWVPLAKKGLVWNVDGQLDGIDFFAGAIESASDTIFVDMKTAKKYFAQKKLKGIVQTIDHAQVLTATVDCEKGGPPFTLSFRGGSMNVTGKATMVKEEGQCLYAIQGGQVDEGQWIIGWPVFAKKGGVVFDIKNNRVGFNK